MAKRRKSSRFRYSYLGEQLLSLFVAPTKDQGFSLGFTDPAFKNIHFTLYFKKEDGRIHTHITDNSAKTKPYSQLIRFYLFPFLGDIKICDNLRIVEFQWIVYGVLVNL